MRGTWLACLGALCVWALPAWAQMDADTTTYGQNSSNHGPMVSTPYNFTGQQNEFPGEPSFKNSDSTGLNVSAEGWSRNPRTVDCNCTYNTNPGLGPVGKIDLSSCSYRPRQGASLTPMAQWARVLPLEQLALGRPCFAGNKMCHDPMGRSLYGAECCMISDPQYVRMTRDAWDWVPMISDIDTDRDDKRFTVIPNGLHPYGQCNFRIDPRSNTVEPSDGSKGPIARILLYYHDVWNVPMTPSQLALYAQWSKDHKPSPNELERANQVGHAQELDNLYYQPNPPIPK